MSRGGVTESRGVTAAPTREVKRPVRPKSVSREAKRRADSALAASVRDSVALLIGRPPASRESSQEVNVPSRRSRDPLDQQIKQMLPDGEFELTPIDTAARKRPSP